MRPDLVSAWRSAGRGIDGAQLRTTARSVRSRAARNRSVEPAISAQIHSAPGGDRTHTSHNGTSDFKSIADFAVGVADAEVARVSFITSARGAAPPASTDALASSLRRPRGTGKGKGR
jgi:L-asparaginase/Glu-tRNA(Gln) amidotransferase subunit D